MGTIMKLIDVIRELDSLHAESTIYAAMPWSETSPAMVATEPAQRGLPAEADRLGLNYFLEVSIARDVLDGWMSNLDQKPSLPDQCARIVKYANSDA